jgi:predicted nucleic acid-binding Zn ribbon protein
MLKGITNKKICKVCGKEFETYIKPHASTILSRSVRSSNCITCSHNCAKEMNYSKYYKRDKK